MNRIDNVLARVLRLAPDHIRDDLAPRDVTTWDSLAGLVLVAELERTFNIVFTLSDVQSIRCVGDIKKILARHGVCE
jgi:acyl carrier protein